MLFLSQLLGTRVDDSSDEQLGYIQDVIVKMMNEEHPKVVGLAIISQGEKLFVHYKYIESLGEKLNTLNTSRTKLTPLEPHRGDLFLARDLLERQIVDLTGAKLVRVNDIQLGKVGDQLCLISVVVGNKSIFRRLGLGFVNALFHLHDNFIRWEDINLIDIPSSNAATLQLKMIREELADLHPADIANIIEDLNTKQSKQLVAAISKVSDEFAADVLEEINKPERLKQIVLDMKPDKAAEIVEKMEPDDAADLLADLPDKKAKELLELMKQKDSEEVEELLTYEDDTVGAVMNTDYVTVPSDYTVEQAIQHIKKISPEFDSIYYVYGVDKQGYLKGVVSLRKLLISPPDKTVKQLMQTNMITVSPHDNPQSAIKKLTKYDLLALCVVDKKKKLLGVVTVDDALRLLVPDA